MFAKNKVSCLVIFEFEMPILKFYWSFLSYSSGDIEGKCCKYERVTKYKCLACFVMFSNAVLAKYAVNDWLTYDKSGITYLSSVYFVAVM